jgi:hypothetical protein
MFGSSRTHMRLVILLVTFRRVHDHRLQSSLRLSRTCRAWIPQHPADYEACNITNRLPPNNTWSFSLSIAMFIGERCVARRYSRVGCASCGWLWLPAWRLSDSFPRGLQPPHFGFRCSAEPFVALYVRTGSLELGVLSGDTEPVTHPTHAPASRDEG